MVTVDKQSRPLLNLHAVIAPDVVKNSVVFRRFLSKYNEFWDNFFNGEEKKEKRIVTKRKQARN